MLSKCNYVFSLILLAATVCGILFLNAHGASAQFLDCDILITKSAPGAGDLEFEFNGLDENGDTFSESLADGQHVGFGVEDGTTTVITEDPQFGWRFGGIECETGPGVIITEIANGFSIDCVDEETGQAECLVTNVQIAGVPTLSEWGMIAAAAGLGLIAVFFAVRRRKAQAV